MLAKFEYWESFEDGQWYFHLKEPQGAIIVQSVGYMTEEDCLEGIEQVRRYADVALVAYAQRLACY